MRLWWLLYLKLVGMSRSWSPVSKWYKEYNALYFNNSLPSTMKVKWVILDPAMLGTYEPDIIELNARFRSFERTTRMTLLHEMAHAATNNEDEEHGPLWKKEMRRLAHVGAFDELW